MKKIKIYLPLLIAFLAMISGTISLFIGALNENNNLLIIAFILFGIAIIIYLILIIIYLILFKKGIKDDE